MIFFYFFFAHMIHGPYFQIRPGRTTVAIRQFVHVGVCQQKVIFTLSAKPIDSSYAKVICGFLLCHVDSLPFLQLSDPGCLMPRSDQIKTL